VKQPFIFIRLTGNLLIGANTVRLTFSSSKVLARSTFITAWAKIEIFSVLYAMVVIVSVGL
jgi:hypothetical protein